MRPETVDESDLADDVESLNDDEDDEDDYEDEEDPVSNRARAGLLNTVRHTRMSWNFPSNQTIVQVALDRIRQTIQLDPSFPWTETLMVTYPHTIDVAVEDDLQRELALYAIPLFYFSFRFFFCGFFFGFLCSSLFSVR
jgi:rRNA-processing protein EBP2